MNRLFRLLPLLSALLLPASPVLAADPAPGMMKVHDLATAFQQVADRNAGRPDAAARDFRETIAPRFPQFYGPERYQGKLTEVQRDAQYVKAFAEFPAIRAAYIEKVSGFTRGLPGHIARFREEFPDYAAATDIWFLHSLGEMDGGVRTLGGKQYFVFGADVMVQVHGNGDEAAFFHHELFHDYQAMGCAARQVWTSLWEEGLATYVSRRMNPGASNAELLLDIPKNLVADTQAQLGAAFEDLHAKLESSDPAAIRSLFQGRRTVSGLPVRRGYYLGYLVAEDIGKTMGMRQMAKLDCASARPVVLAAVERLRKAHPAGAGLK